MDDANVDYREHDASALCATCGKTWGLHIGRCCDDDESSPRRFKLATGETPSNVRELIEDLCSAAVSYGERDTKDAENAYYAAKAHLIGAVASLAALGVSAPEDQTFPQKTPGDSQ